MQIIFEYHGVLRRQSGSAEHAVEVPAGSTLASALDTLGNAHPEIRELLPRCACAIGEQLLLRRQLLDAPVRIALLPPVAGG